jgi:hypothetical protein
MINGLALRPHRSSCSAADAAHSPRRKTAQIADSVCPPRASGRELLSPDAHRVLWIGRDEVCDQGGPAGGPRRIPATASVPRTGAHDTHDQNVPFSATGVAMGPVGPHHGLREGRVAGSRESGAAPSGVRSHPAVGDDRQGRGRCRGNVELRSGREVAGQCPAAAPVTWARWAPERRSRRGRDDCDSEHR